jgi:hypothetical protein
MKSQHSDSTRQRCPDKTPPNQGYRSLKKEPRINAKLRKSVRSSLRFCRGPPHFFHFKDFLGGSNFFSRFALIGEIRGKRSKTS